MIRILILIMLVSFSIVAPVQAAEKKSSAASAAQEQDSGRFALLLEKLKQHPEIQAYVSRAESSRYNATGELGLPDPMLFIQEQDYPIGTSMSRDQEQKMIGFKQVIPAFGTRGAKSDRLGVESRKNKLLGDYAYAAMKSQFINSIANLARIEEQEKLLAQQALLFGSERTSLKGRIAANQATQSQLVLSEADSTDIQLMGADLGEEKHEIMAMLDNMVGETPDIPLPAIDKVAWDRDVENTYPVRIAAQDIEMARKDVDLRESEFNPNFEVQASYGRMNGGDNAGTVMVGMSIPLWAAQNQQPKLSGAQSGLRAAESDQENIKRQTLQKLTHLEAQIDASDRKIELLQHKESFLNASRGAQTREYEAGKSDLSKPLKTRRDMVSVRYQLAAERAKRTALIADFNHYFIEGEK
ncbi:MAG: hypothetical protein E6R05_00305 [Candidatus Moraniibacteriota bacterium]|nr:MAG: hypothetical protein E6R05_00305 [Candidatus Moranbacteria bacterium]